MHAAHRAGLITFIALAATWMALPVAAQSLAAGVDHNCTISSTGGVVCWGSNQYGQIGDGTTITRTAPTNVSLPFGVTSLAGNWGQSCAVTSAGAVKCWGWNLYGQLGDGSKIQRNSPVDVSGLGSGVARVSAGFGHTCALTTSGGIKCWGADVSPASNNGELGNGANSGALAPGDVIGFAAGAGALAVAAGKSFTCAVTATGGAKCWGANVFDQLGNNDPVFADQNTPVNVLGLTSGVASVATGEIHACALTNTGGVKCWGYAQNGALGNNSQASFTQPVAADVTGLTSGVAAITAGTSHTCAMKSTGEVLCWGSNAQGQIGDGTNTQRNTPVSVASGAIAISAGAFHTCILTAVGVSQCWGNNAQGNLGNGTQGGPSYVPTPTTYPAATTTSVVSASNPSVFGDSVTFTATVSGGINGVGVNFLADGVTIAGCSAVALSAGSAGCTTGALQGGARSITAVYAGNATSLASQSVVLVQAVNRADQTITFDPLPTKTDTDLPFTIAATASSGLSVVFSSLTPAICTVSGTTVTIVVLGANTCTIAANQSGSGNYNAAPQVAQSFSILGSLPPLILLSVKSRKTHGAAGDFDIAINPATPIASPNPIDVECRAIGTGHRIIFTFNIPITATGTVAVTDKDGNPFAGAVPSLSSAGNDVIITVTGIPDNRRAKFTLTNVNAGGLTFSTSVGFLIGDINNSRSVTGTDVGVVRGRSGQVVTAANFKSDLNSSGTLTGTDVSVVRPRSGLVIP